MRIEICRQASQPLYLQVKEQLQERIEQGTLLPGTKLPPTRGLAEELGVSRVTVVNAYAELEVEGLVEGQVGRGTFVVQPDCPAVSRQDNPFDWRTTLLRPSGVSASGMLADMLHLAQHPDLISFALGAPATDLLPVREFREAINRALRGGGAAALQYDDAAGYAPLRRAIVDLLSASDIPASAGDVLITSGSQQALDLSARVLARPGDVVVTESPTYLGALDVFQSHGLDVVGVPVDQDGICLDALEGLLARHRPQLVYTISAFQNPTGATLSEERRWGLLRLARRHDFRIIEDGVCSELGYEGTLPPALKALDLDQRVIYINSFSKSLLPGIRLGYLLASGHLRERLIAAKRATDLFTSVLLQRALFEYLKRGHLTPHLQMVRRVYRQRRDAMLAALAAHMPPQARWTRPCGGLCLWVNLPPSINTAHLYVTAIEHGVAFAVGAVFFPERPTSSALRLNFAAHPCDRIAEGIRRLGSAIEEEGRRTQPAGRPRRAAFGQGEPVAPSKGQT